MNHRIRHSPGTTPAALLAVAVLAGAGCSTQDTNAGTFREGERDPGSGREEAVPVEVATLGRGHIEAIQRFSSNLEAERNIQVFAEAPRRVTELLVEEGDHVRRGQVLVRLQDEEQRSALARSESQLTQSRRDLERTEELFHEKLVTEKVYRDAEYAVERDELAVADARRELGYTEVRAPLAGTVTERLVDLGDHVTVNQPLFRIVDFDSIVARIYVPEQELVHLAVDQPARLRSEALGGLAFKGQIDRVSPVVDPQTGTIKVTVATPRQEGLRPGMFVEVELVTAVRDDALLVPKTALVYDNDRVFVFRLGDERRVERLPLVPAFEDPGFVMPLEGFQEGDQVVVAGQSGLKDGALVRLPGDPEPEDAQADDDAAE